MVESGTPEIETLRSSLTGEQRAILNAVWEQFRDQNEWFSRGALHRRWREAAVRACLQHLGSGILREIEEDGEHYYRLTFLGVLLTDQGVESEELLARYLEYIRNRWASDPRLEWIGSQEVETALCLTPQRSRLLRQLIRLSHWWGGGSGFGDQEWTVGVPVNVDDLPPEGDLRAYVRGHVLSHFPPGPDTVQAGKARGDFWFISEPALQRRLTLDWREAQDVYQVRGWKSCVILCGGILEAVLLDALATAGYAPPGPGRPSLVELLEAARSRAVLGNIPPLGDALREFPHLIHPGLLTPGGIEVTRDEAESALIMIRMCLRQLGTPGGATRPIQA